MSFNSGNLVTSAVSRVRLLIGDVSDIPFLDDVTYEYIIANSETELDAAISALENIISIILLEPLESSTGDTSQGAASLEGLESKLVELREKKTRDAEGVRKIPMRIHAGREDWKDFDFFHK